MRMRELAYRHQSEITAVDAPRNRENGYTHGPSHAVAEQIQQGLHSETCVATR